MTDKCLVANIQRYSINDGPGIRTLVILMGCNLKCVWCHNPETISGKNEIYWKTMNCVQCGLALNTVQKMPYSPLYR